MGIVTKSKQPIWQLMGRLFRAHPWHGVRLGEKDSDVVTCYIEITPSDTVKYELDKATGLLKLDRPQRFSNFCPALYGLLPQTYCGTRVAELSAEKTGRPAIMGDQDPLMCVSCRNGRCRTATSCCRPSPSAGSA